MNKKDLPTLGVGLGYRRDLDEYVNRPDSTVEWLEVVTDEFIPLAPSHRQDLDRLVDASFPLVPHGVGLSLGSVSPMDESYIQQVQELVSAVRPPWFTDHLGFGRLAVHALPSLFPPYRDRESANRVADRIRLLQDKTDTPFLFENLAVLADPAGPISEPEYINAITDRADCGILLDVMNLRSRCHAFGVNPYAFIDELDVDRVVQVHVAGGRWVDGLLYDTHSEPADEQTWDLLAYLASKTSINAVLLEWDADYPETEEDKFDRIESEFSAARRALAQAEVIRAEGPRERLNVTSDAQLFPLHLTSQTHLEQAFEGAYRSLQRKAGLKYPNDADGFLEVFDSLAEADRDTLENFLAERWSKRFEFLAAPFANTMRYLAVFHEMPTERVGIYLDSTFPRVVAGEQQVGFRVSETNRFVEFAEALGAHLHDPVLGYLAAYEAQVELVTLQARENADIQEGSDLDADAHSQGGAGTLSLSPRARLFKAPYDVPRLHRGLENGDPVDALRDITKSFAGEKFYAVVAPAEGEAIAVFEIGSDAFLKLNEIVRTSDINPDSELLNDPVVRTAIKAKILLTA